MKHCLGEVLILVLLVFNDELVFNIIQIIFIIIPLNPWTPYTNFSNKINLKNPCQDTTVIALGYIYSLPLRRLYLVLH